jgi:eukaryotic-like serine/threonine-protein kinase
LRSPHVVQVFDYGIDGEMPFIAMELLEGEDLGQRLKRGSRLDPKTAAALLVQMAKGLGKAHEAGIVHRDLKPKNVFLASTEEGEIVKLLDFGIAKFTGEIGGDTKTGELIGSPHFMSPEQSHGAKTVDHRSDLWSLGAIVYRMLTGKNPFEGEGIGELIMKINTQSPPPPSTVVPGLPKELDAFFEKAFMRDPSERFQSARELATAFFTLVGEPSWSGAWGPSVRSSHAAIGSFVAGESSSMTPAPVHKAVLGDSFLEGANDTSASQKPAGAKRWALGVMAGAILLVGVIVALLLMLRDGPAARPDEANTRPDEAEKRALLPPAPPVSVAPVWITTAAEPPAAPSSGLGSVASASPTQAAKAAAPVASLPRTSSKEPSSALAPTSGPKKRPKLGY